MFLLKNRVLCESLTLQLRNRCRYFVTLDNKQPRRLSDKGYEISHTYDETRYLHSYCNKTTGTNTLRKF